MNDSSERLPRSLFKHLFFWVVTLASPVFLLELFLRIYFAFTVGPSALLYGFKSTGAQQHIDPAGYFRENKEKNKNHTVDDIPNLLENPVLSYTKYAPYQETVDHNDSGDVFDVHINGSGFRGPEFEREKKPGTLRVITLGASSTFGYHDRDDETYPHYLRDTLEQYLVHHNCGAYTAVEVINFGIPHHTSENIVALFEAEALPLHPDVVTFYEGINDAHQAVAPASIAGKAKGALKGIPLLTPLYTFLRSHMILVGLIADLNQSIATRYSSEEIEYHLAAKGSRFIRNLDRIRTVCRGKGILFVVATQQAKSGIIERENIKGVTYEQEVQLLREKLAGGGKVGLQERALLTHSVIMDSLRAWAHHNSLPLADVVRALDEDRDVLITWVHLTPPGNRTIASVFARVILPNICHFEG